jgi:hypothetical protein
MVRCLVVIGHKSLVVRVKDGSAGVASSPQREPNLTTVFLEFTPTDSLIRYFFHAFNMNVGSTVTGLVSRYFHDHVSQASLCQLLESGEELRDAVCEYQIISWTFVNFSGGLL